MCCPTPLSPPPCPPPLTRSPAHPPSPPLTRPPSPPTPLSALYPHPRPLPPRPGPSPSSLPPPPLPAHGLLRTAHALRALQDAETPLRIEELGAALAYWAAYYRRLPGVPHLSGTLDWGQALAGVPFFLRGQARQGMPREVALRVTEAQAEAFSVAVDQAAEPESVQDALSPLTEAGARLYLANASRQPLVLLTR